ncbi:unnamed protein product [Rhizophagus irregularis]|nr:unnamed protein product [Rhizophagus irregularis]
MIYHEKLNSDNLEHCNYSLIFIKFMVISLIYQKIYVIYVLLKVSFHRRKLVQVQLVFQIPGFPITRDHFPIMTIFTDEYIRKSIYSYNLVSSLRYYQLSLSWFYRPV